MTFKPKKDTREVLSLHLSGKLSRRLNKAMETSGLKKQHLIRQMIEFCLDNIQFEPKIQERLEEREDF